MINREILNILVNNNIDIKSCDIRRDYYGEIYRIITPKGSVAFNIDNQEWMFYSKPTLDERVRKVIGLVKELLKEIREIRKEVGLDFPKIQWINFIENSALESLKALSIIETPE